MSNLSVLEKKLGQLFLIWLSEIKLLNPTLVHINKISSKLYYTLKIVDNFS